MAEEKYFGVSGENGFLSGMPFSIYKVVGLIIAPFLLGHKQTNYATDKPCKRLYK